MGRDDPQPGDVEVGPLWVHAESVAYAWHSCLVRCTVRELRLQGRHPADELLDLDLVLGPFGIEVDEGLATSSRACSTRASAPGTPV